MAREIDKVVSAMLRRIVDAPRIMYEGTSGLVGSIAGNRRLDDLSVVYFILAQHLIAENEDHDNYLYLDKSQAYKATCDTHFSRDSDQALNAPERSFIGNLHAGHRTLVRRVIALETLDPTKENEDKLPRYFNIRRQFLDSYQDRGLRLADLPWVLARELSYEEILKRLAKVETGMVKEEVKTVPVERVSEPPLNITPRPVCKIERKGPTVATEEIAYSDFSASEIYLLSFLLAARSIKKNGLAINKRVFLRQGNFVFNKIDKSPLEVTMGELFNGISEENAALENICPCSFYFKLLPLVGYVEPDDITSEDRRGRYGRAVMGEFRKLVRSGTELGELFETLGEAKGFVPRKSSQGY